MFDVEILARIQFALTVMFHYIFPPMSIGLGWMMVLYEGRFIATGDRHYEQIARFWTRIFAIIFAVGVASGIVMEFQFGTNWAVYSRFVGDVFGSALAAEGIFAFFLESSFLAVLIFGWDRVSSRTHFIATLLVACGATFSAVWIVVANSWQQTPDGFQIMEHSGMLRAEITDFWQVVFNPSSMLRLGHVLIGAVCAGSFLVMSVSAWYLLKNKHVDFARRAMPGAIWVSLIFSLLAPMQGHFQAERVAHTQPAKLAAFEGHFETGAAPLYLFGWVNEASEKTYGPAIPGGLSFLLHLNFTDPVPALDQFRPEDRPPVNLTFQSYHIMVAVGMAMIGVALLAAFLNWRGKLHTSKWMLWILVASVLLPQIGNQTGWVAAEVGRQPWIVNPPVERGAQGDLVLDDEGYAKFQTETVTLESGETVTQLRGLRTSDALSEAVKANQVLGSILMFLFIYLLMFCVWIVVLTGKIQHGPDPIPAGEQ